MLEKINDFTSCSLAYVASILSGKWKPFIVWYLSLLPGRRARYSELRKTIPYDISHKMFNQHLSELENAGIIERIVVETKPLHVDYLLTKKGVSFANVLYFLRDWGAVYGDFSTEALLRTKGTMDDGVLVYGDEAKGVEGGSDERIVWRVNPAILAARIGSWEVEHERELDQLGMSSADADAVEDARDESADGEGLFVGGETQGGMRAR